MAEQGTDTHLIIGTAGHVDHGKTTLIRALTGQDTDRLPEEKRRGISIELGFAPFVLPSGRRAGVVDVPGHERFVRHMVAGAFGMDAVLLVVAADEGIMPQTEEHLAILTLLGLGRGLVVLTKTDLIGTDQRLVVERELRRGLAETFLKDAPILPFSAPTGQGLAEILAAIDQLTANLPARPASGPIRLPVDRSFVASGFGTVVTGTLFSGQVAVDDRLLAVPAAKSVRVRQIQVHGEGRKTARAGQRVALNLVGAEKGELGRGSLVLGSGGGDRTDTIYARLSVLAGERTIKTDQRLHLHALTFEVMGRVVLLDGDHLSGGQSALARIRLEHPLWLLPADRIVLRQVAPAATVGGGVVIATSGHFRRHHRQDLADLRQMETGGVGGRLEVAASRLLRLDPGAEASAELLAELTRRKVLIRVGDQYLGEVVLRARQQALVGYLKQLGREHPERLGERAETLRQRFFKELDGHTFAQLLAALEQSHTVRLGDGLVGLPEVKADLDNPLEAPARLLLEQLAKSPFTPPSAAELGQAMGVPEAQVDRLGRYLAASSRVVRVGAWLFTAGALEEAAARVAQWFASHPQMTAGEFRDLLGTSRRYAIPLLEYFDSRRLTRRVGEVRVPYR
jgi:selenocysteine-specific elongation factor